MVRYMVKVLMGLASAITLGCASDHKDQATNGVQKTSNPSSTINSMESPESQAAKIEPRNEFGFAKISMRKGDSYYEGIVDGNGDRVVPLIAKMLVDDITGKVALVRFENKFLFVPLDGGAVSEDDLASVNGFQYAEPHRCGLAMVSVNDSRFYINSEFQRAFDSIFEFAESYHHNRALVRSDGKYRIIDTEGKSVADLNYYQVNSQSEWCWQVTNKENGEYKSGFVDLEGKLITELIYDQVGYYDPQVKRIWVCKDRRYGFLNEYARTAVPVKYEYAEVFDRGKAKVVLNGRTFFIDPDGNELPE